METNARESSITLHTSNVIVFFAVSSTKIVKRGKIKIDTS